MKRLPRLFSPTKPPRPSLLHTRSNTYQLPHPTSYPLLQTFLHLSRHGSLPSALAAMADLSSHGLRADSSDPTACAHLISRCLSAGPTDGPPALRLLHRYLTIGHHRPFLFLLNSLLSAYFKLGLPNEARQLFDEIPMRNVVSYTTMISSLIHLKQSKEALTLFIQMQREGVQPNVYTFSSVLRACDNVRTIWFIHCPIIKVGLESDVFVRSSLIDIYAKFGDLENGYRVFSEMVTRDLVVWNSIIGGYAQSGDGYRAIELFTQMKRFDFYASQATLTSVLRACTGMVMLEMGRQVHGHVVKYRKDLILDNAILDMYCKCGSLDEADAMFERMAEKDVISWSTMISGLAQNGRSLDALKLFKLMKDVGARPNHITMVGVLFACSHAGLVDDGWQYFHSMEELFNIKPSREHYGCMIDILGRAGKLEEALKFIKEMDLEPDSVIWRTLLGACRVHRKVDLAAYAAKEVLKLEPGDEGTYILLSNIYANCHRWDDVEEIRRAMKGRGVRKEPGRSWIEVGKKIHVFIVGDLSHPQSEDIYKELIQLISRICEVGYVPDTEFVLHDLGKEQKEELIQYHSEKLAIAFGLMNSAQRKPIRVMKNLRICGDCHTFAKLVAKTEGKTIIIRDPIRFHHFKDGACSCGDYW